MATAYGMKKRMAKGGMIGSHQSKGKPEVHADFPDKDHHMEEKASGFVGHQGAAPKSNEAAMHEDADMIARIMHKRKMYSEGGMVANAKGPGVEDMSSDYDDMQDDTLAFHDTAKNSGDELGEDMVSKIMKKRAK